MPVENITGILDDTLRELLPDTKQFSTVNVLVSSYDNHSKLQLIVSELQRLDTVICDIVERSKNMVKRLLTLNMKIHRMADKILAVTKQSVSITDRLENMYTKYFDAAERENIQAMDLEFQKTMTKEKKKAAFSFLPQSLIPKRQSKLISGSIWKIRQSNQLILKPGLNQIESENSNEHEQEVNIKKQILEVLTPIERTIFRGAMKNVGSA